MEKALSAQTYSACIHVITIKNGSFQLCKQQIIFIFDNKKELNPFQAAAAAVKLCNSVHRECRKLLAATAATVRLLKFKQDALSLYGISFFYCVLCAILMRIEKQWKPKEIALKQRDSTSEAAAHS